MRDLTTWLVPGVLLLAAACGPGDEVIPSSLLHDEQGYGVRTVARPCKASGFNAYVMDAANSFGKASYLWKGDGVTRKIYYQGSLLLKPYAPGVCYCVGATFQVYISAFEAWDKKHGSKGSLGGLSVAQVKKFRATWYVATSKLTGVQAALVDHQLGQAITKRAEARPGDFVQFWRNNKSGHSAVFTGWKYSNGKINGITYFSCQGGGAGHATETIGAGSKQIDPQRIHLGRAAYPGPMPTDAGPPPKKDSKPPPKKDSKPPPKKDSKPPPKKDSGPPPDQGQPVRADGGATPPPQHHLDGGCAMASANRGLTLSWLLLLWAAWRRRP